ncbi:MAG: sigma-70 family RNA polymerase sigma factor [bacterium]
MSEAVGDSKGLSIVSESPDSGPIQFEEAYLRYRSRAFYAACALVGDREEAMELVHEAFLRAYRAWDRFDQDRRFYPWLHKILRNLCLNRLRSRRRNPAKESLDNLEDQGVIAPSTDPGPLSVMDQKERGERVWQAVMSLAPDDREMILLREYHGLSYSAIAEAVGCPLGTVMSRLHAARKRLRSAIEKRGISI